MNDSKQLKLYWILPGGYSDTRESLSIPAYHRDDVDAVLDEYAAREQRLKEWIDKVDDEIGWNHENDEIGQAVEAALTTVVKQFCTVWSQGITSCPVCGSGGSCKHRKQRKQRASKHAQEKP